MTSKIPRPLTLIILDGFGLNPDSYGNVIAEANKPNYDRLIKNYPNTAIGASGLDVGLPDGQMGNSEVGHLNFGAGRVVYQEVTRIDKSIADGDFFDNQVIVNQITKIKNNSGKLHLLGLASDGLVHSSLEHLFALLNICNNLDFHEVYIHAFLDGRDVSPTKGASYIESILNKCEEIGVGKLATVVGRYYAMDRDKRWERVKIAYDLVIRGIGQTTDDPVSVIKQYYKDGITDEFMKPMIVGDSNHIFSSNDGVIFFNFRADRGRQLSYALTDENFDGFDREGGPIVPLVTLTLYAVALKAEVAFAQQNLEDTLGKVIGSHGLKQLRTSETEKYPHVTFFFNGGKEIKQEGEDWELVNSSKVATYDLKPEMSAYELTDLVVGKINNDEYDVIIINFANCDMVGHTGDYDATIIAVETVDKCLGKVVEAVRNAGGVALVTADHGNADKMLEPDGSPLTAHTIFKVPFILVDDNFKGTLRNDGILADVAPTMLDYLNIEKPKAMTGETLLIKQN